MPSINMIAARRAEKRRQENNVRRLVYAIAGEFGVSLVVLSVMLGRLMTVNGQVADLRTQADKLQPTVAQIEKMQKDTQAMQPKVATLEGARADTLFWYDGFQAMTSCLPAQAWLTTLATAGGGGDGTPGTAGGADPQLSVGGVALSQAQVGQAILQMNQSPRLDHVDLALVQQQKTGTVSTVSFQMTVHLKPQAAAADKKGAGDVQKS